MNQHLAVGETEEWSCGVKESVKSRVSVVVGLMRYKLTLEAERQHRASPLLTASQAITGLKVKRITHRFSHKLYLRQQIHQTRMYHRRHIRSIVYAHAWLIWEELHRKVILNRNGIPFFYLSPVFSEIGHPYSTSKDRRGGLGVSEGYYRKGPYIPGYLFILFCQ